MITEIIFTLRRMLGAILGWGVGLLLLAFLLVPLYETLFSPDQLFDMTAFIQSMPQEFMVFFGDMALISTPMGYLTVEFFSYMPVLIGFFMITTGSGLLINDEESGRLDLVLSHPINRVPLFAARCIAFLAAILGILLLAWLGVALPTLWTEIDITFGELIFPFLSMLGVLMVYGSLALLLSMLLPSRQIASMVSGFLLVASYLLTSLARLNSDLTALSRLLPFEYYQTNDAVTDFNLVWFVALLGVSLVLTLLAGVLFRRRDIRVAGEGSWSLFSRKQTAR